MNKFGPEWTMFYVAYRTQGRPVEVSESMADLNLFELMMLRIPPDSVWVKNDSDLSKCLHRVKVLRHDAEFGVEVRQEHSGFQYFESASVLLDESRWFRVAQ